MTATAFLSIAVLGRLGPRDTRAWLALLGGVAGAGALLLALVTRIDVAWAALFPGLVVVGLWMILLGGRIGALAGGAWIVGAFAVAASIQFQKLFYLAPAVLAVVGGEVSPQATVAP